MKNNSLGLPPPKILPNSDVILPHVVLGDEAFPLMENLMKPYPRSQSLVDHSKAIFNYRLSRARRIVENAFGILTHRFGIYNTPIHLNSDTLEYAVTATCIIHNLLADAKVPPKRKTNDEVIDLEDIQPFDDSESTKEPTEIRNKFREYFNSVGQVSWQNYIIRL